MTPSMFAWLQSSLRETYKALYVPGDPCSTAASFRPHRPHQQALRERLGRPERQPVVDHPQECLAARLQLGEQALTGETGRNAEDQPVADRDHDCVLNIAYAIWGDGGGGGTTFYPGNVNVPGGSASTQAAQVHFHSP